MVWRRRFLAAGVLAVTAVACVETLNLSSTSQEAVVEPVLTPGSNFGNVQVGSSSGSATIQIQPASGSNTDTVNRVDTSGCGSDFSLSIPTTPATVSRVCTDSTGSQISGSDLPQAVYLGSSAGTGASCATPTTFTVVATFHPTHTGTQSCPITFVIDNGVMNKTVNLVGTGTPPPFDVDVSTTKLDFGSVHVDDDSGKLDFKLSNIGANTLDISSITIQGSDFVVLDPKQQDAHSIGAGSSEAVSIVCHPHKTGTTNSTSTITFGSASKLPPLSVGLGCNGVDTNVQGNPSPAAFLTKRVGEAQPTITVTLKNSGTTPAAIEALSLLPGQGGSPLADLSIATSSAAGTTLGVGSATDVALAWTPSVPVSGEIGVLHVEFDGTKTTDISIQGTSQVAAASVTPDGPQAFPQMCAQQSTPLPFVLSNIGDGPVAITGLDIAGSDASQFEVVHDSFPIPADSHAAQFSVNAVPTTGGPHSAELSIQTDIPGLAAHVIPLTVQALAAGVVPSETSLDLGGVKLGKLKERDVALTNCDGSDVELMSATVDSDEFTVTNEDEWKGTLANASSASLHVVYAPHVTGVVNGTLHIVWSTGSADVALVGTGEGDGGLGSGSDTQDPLRDSYYRCSAGGPSGALPLGIAFGLLALRRRRS